LDNALKQPDMGVSPQCPVRDIGHGPVSWIELELAAFANNLSEIRRLTCGRPRLYQVCKGDGYGLGLERVIDLGRAAGIDCFCVGDPSEARRARVRAPESQILLFVSTLPEDLPAICADGIDVTVTSLAALHAICEMHAPCHFFFEVDVGFGRFGIPRHRWDECLRTYLNQSTAVCRGVYSHLGHVDEPDLTRRLARFDEFIASMKALVPHKFETMIASSHTLLQRPDLAYTAIDPGRLLYGLMETKYLGGLRTRPVLAAIRSKIIEITRPEPNETMKIAYGAAMSFDADTRLGVFPIGWLAGLSARPPYGEVVIHGQLAPVVGRTLLHSIVNLTGIATAQIASVATLVGDGYDLERMAAAQNVSATELHFKLGRSLPHVVIDQGA
jgi:alanine racemase